MIRCWPVARPFAAARRAACIRAANLATMSGATVPKQRIQAVRDMTALHKVLGMDLHLITPDCSLYTASAEDLESLPCGEPYWGFCWPGSYALADYILNNPEMVRGKRVLDIGSGCGIAALVSLQAGVHNSI